MATSFTARFLAESEYDKWTHFTRDSPSGSIYSTPVYLAALSAATGGSFRVLAIEKGDALVGGVALYVERRRGVDIVSPRLLLYYNGIVFRGGSSKYPSKETAERLNVCWAVRDFLERHRYGRVALRSLPEVYDVRPFQAHGWSVTPSYSYVVSVDDPSACWDRIEQNLRRLVARAESAGLTVSDDDDFDSFYRLHSETMERKSKAPYLSKDGFARYFLTLHGQGRALLLNARLPDGRAVATTLCLMGDQPLAHVVSAAADVDTQHLGTNAFLRWHAFRALHTRGFQRVDLTDASLNPVTKFKSQLGGDLALTFQVEGPQTARHRVTSRLFNAYFGTRRAAGRSIRSLIRRMSPATPVVDP